MVEKFMTELLGMNGGGPVLTLIFVFLLVYFLYHQIIKPNSKSESTDSRLSKIELAIHDVRNLLQQEVLRNTMMGKDVEGLKLDSRDHASRLTILETEFRVMRGPGHLDK